MPSLSNSIARTPQSPYYAVIFTSQRTDGDRGYGRMADRMATLASQIPGFLGMESVRDLKGLGITVSYWESEDAIRRWKIHSEHQVAQETGKKVWYTDYVLRIARVERTYGKDPNKTDHSFAVSAIYKRLEAKARFRVKV
jgi:heme-degrading monooxygenase HmoA